MSKYKHSLQSPPLGTMISTFFSFIIVITVGHIQDLCIQFFRVIKTLYFIPYNLIKYLHNKSKNIKEIFIDEYKNIPLTTDFETFFIRRLFQRIKTCWNRSITGPPGKYIKLVMRPENYNDPDIYTYKPEDDIENYDEAELNDLLRIGYETGVDCYDICKFNRIGDLIRYKNSYSKRYLKRLKKLSCEEIKDVIKKREENFKNIKEDISFESCLKELKKTGNTFLIREIEKRKDLLEKARISKRSDLKTKKVLNIGSYNYLGFGENKPENIESALKALEKYPITISAPSFQTGTLEPIRLLERAMAKFLRLEDAMVFSMGFGTNSTALPVLLDEETLVFSDELNHRSIIYGTQLSRATVKTFAHNDMNDLENKLKHYIAQGQEKTHRDWKKVFVLVEGVYSMEGTIVPLEKLCALRKKYKFYIFVDEAHSIGAIGRSGKGVSRLFKHNLHEQVDVFMGTFTKSFGGMGGYIAGSKKLINYLKSHCDSALYGEQMPAVIASHILSSLRKLSVKNFEFRKRLKMNIKFMRKKLKKEGFIIFGDERSPIIPLLIFNPGKIPEFSKMCLQKNIAVVVVGFPATPVLSSRARICLSGIHTEKEIKKVTKEIIKIGKKLKMNVL